MREPAPASMPSRVQWDAALYDTRHAYIARYGVNLVDNLAPVAGELILDLGCGTGALTQEIANRGARVIGMDISPGMVEQARANYPDLEFHLADAADFRLAETFDAVFSNATLHWIRASAQAAVAANVYRALRPAGRFVAELGGQGNVRAIVTAIGEALASAGFAPEKDPNPWYNPSLGEYASLLERAGFDVVQAAHFERMTRLDAGEAGMRNWIDMWATDFLAHVPTHVRTQVIADAEAQLKPRFYKDGVWSADYRRLRVAAIRL